jgi:hypothetical protein
MSRKSPSQLKILNDTLDLMTLMTHCTVLFGKCALFFMPSNMPSAKNDKYTWQKFVCLKYYC